jgi:hypothetical protein
MTYDMTPLYDIGARSAVSVSESGAAAGNIRILYNRLQNNRIIYNRTLHTTHYNTTHYNTITLQLFLLQMWLYLLQLACILVLRGLAGLIVCVVEIQVTCITIIDKIILHIHTNDAYTPIQLVLVLELQHPLPLLPPAWRREARRLVWTVTHPII